MSQGKTKKSSNSGSQHSYHKLKKQIRHGQIKCPSHHLSKAKPENVPSKNKDSTNDPGLLSKIYNHQINQDITKKIKTHQKKIY